MLATRLMLQNRTPADVLRLADATSHLREDVGRSRQRCGTSLIRQGDGTSAKTN